MELYEDFNGGIYRLLAYKYNTGILYVFDELNEEDLSIKCYNIKLTKFEFKKLKKI